MFRAPEAFARSQCPTQVNHDERVTTCSSTFEGELSIGLLNLWLNDVTQTKGADLFRYKGILAIKGTH